MNLIENYLTENGYDYFGNAAEDTLVFFVRDNNAPSGESCSPITENPEKNNTGTTVNNKNFSLE